MYEGLVVDVFVIFGEIQIIFQCFIDYMVIVVF